MSVEVVMYSALVVSGSGGYGGGDIRSCPATTAQFPDWLRLIISWATKQKKKHDGLIDAWHRQWAFETPSVVDGDSAMEGFWVVEGQMEGEKKKAGDAVTLRWVKSFRLPAQQPRYLPDCLIAVCLSGQG